MESEIYKKLTKDVKTPEEIFLEIINFVKNNKNNNEDNRENKNNIVFTNLLGYSKMRNFSKENYVYTSDIQISEIFKVHFYFSNKRSYFSIDPKKNCNYEEYFSLMQLINLIYCDKLFKEYSIDTFIYNFNQNSSKNGKEISTQTNLIIK
jgi:hypothetical protein